MSPEIKWDLKNVEGNFRKVLLWYLDHGMGEPSRRQAYITLGDLLDIPARTVERWITVNRPKLWHLVLEKLENEYGPPPEELLKDGKAGE